MAIEPRRDSHNILITPHLGSQEAAQLRLLLDRGASILVVAPLTEVSDADAESIVNVNLYGPLRVTPLQDHHIVDQQRLDV